jgi:hypothetical protein
VNPHTKLPLITALALASFSIACGGGGNPTPAPPPPPGPFSTSSLNGTYAFEMSGTDAGGFFARVGSFVANGSGTITSGVEDVNTGQLQASVTFAFTGGSYAMQSNGQGTLSLTNQTGTLQFSIVMTSAKSGFLIEIDGTAASGNFTLQDTNAFSTANINGPYAFDIAGIAPNGSPESLIGQFTANGGGGINSSSLDINNGSPSGQLTFTSASFVMDGSSNGANFGRGIASLAANGSTFNFAFYIVDAAHIRFLRTDYPAVSVGDATAQTGTIPTSVSAFNGSFVLVLGGSSLSGADARGGRLTLNSGTIANIQMDDNDSSASGSGNSNPVQIPSHTGAISNATYTLDPNGTGRGTLTFTDSSLGTYVFIFYLSSPTQAFIQDNSNGFVSDGSMSMQAAASLTNSALAGNYALTWSGVSVNGSTGAFGEEDNIGQYTLSSAAPGVINGGLDFTSLSAQSVITGVSVTGTQTLASDPTGRNQYQLTVHTSPSATINFSIYFVDSNTAFIIGTDTHRIAAGTVLRNY